MIRLLHGDCIERLRELPEESVHMCVTSPPYYGLRDYGVAGQIGLEPTLDEYLAKMVEVFREVRRVLRSDGTLWLNLGASYASGGIPASQSLLRVRDPACGTDDTGLPSSQGVDRACPDSCGGPQDETQSHHGHNAHSAQSVSQAGLQMTQTGRDTAPLGSGQSSPPISLLGALSSTTPASPLRGLGGACREDAASEPPSEQPTSQPCVPGSGHTSACTCGKPKTRQPLAPRTKGTESFFSACDRSDCDGVGRCGFCFVSLTIASLDIKAKDLLGVPWMVAMALQADGWYLRSEIIWHKKSAMPESVRDRPTKAHEHIFLLAKSDRYFYDAEAASEPVAGDPDHPRNRWDTRDEEIPGQKPQKRTSRSGNKERKPASARGVPVEADGSTNGAVAGSIPWEGSTRNWRDVWHLGPEPCKEAHFATFPTEIPRRAIVAGTSEKGCCPSCGAGWVRREEVVGRQVTDAMRYAGGNSDGEYHGEARKDFDGSGVQNASDTKRRILERMSQVREHSWAQGCSCPPADPVPATILDPFLGSGTTALVADRLQRDCIGIELNSEYAAMAERRIRGDAPLFAEVA